MHSSQSISNDSASRLPGLRHGEDLPPEPPGEQRPTALLDQLRPGRRPAEYGESTDRTPQKRHRACLSCGHCSGLGRASSVCLPSLHTMITNRIASRKKTSGLSARLGLRIATTGVRRSRPSTTSPSAVRTALTTFVATALPIETCMMTDNIIRTAIKLQLWTAAGCVVTLMLLVSVPIETSDLWRTRLVT